MQPMDGGPGNFRPRPGEVYMRCREKQYEWDAALDSGETLPPQVWRSNGHAYMCVTYTVCVALINPLYTNYIMY